MKKIFALLFTLILLLSLYPPSARAADATISSGNTYDLASYGNGSEIRITTTEPVTLTQSNPETALTDFEIDCDVPGVNLTIDGININNSANSGRCALSFTGTGNTLTLAGASKLTSGTYEPGILIESDTELNIGGEGSVDATGGRDGAGIGSGRIGKIGKIIITDGTITATGGETLDYGAAGIGGGYSSSHGEIVITGGIVTANGKKGAAGIGAGSQGRAGKITISGGTVTANGGPNGSGIGAGQGGTPAFDEIVISGGTVTANGGLNAAGIGGGMSTDANIIIIKNSAQVTATGGSYGAGIGGGAAGKCGNIKIADRACVTATGGDNAAGIGTGVGRSGGSIIISDRSYVTATGGDNAAGIGGGYQGSADYIYIFNSEVKAFGGSNSSGIGIGYEYSDTSAHYITISSSRVFAAASDSSKYDIGDDLIHSSISLNGNSSIFLRYDNIGDNLYANLTHFDYTSVDSNNEILGIEMPSGWPGAGGYHQEYITVSYDTNGATGTSPQSKNILKGTSIELPTSSGFSKGGLILLNWNTHPDGTGDGFAPGKSYSFSDSTTLYAVWVDKDVTSVEINAENLKLTQGETVKLSAEVLPVNASQSSVSWTTSDGSVAAVSASGLVTAAGAGDCTITAEADGITDSCTVTVSKKTVTYISLDCSSQKMYEGGVFALTATVTPDDAADPTITWESSNSAVAAVNKNGIVTAMGEGIATITATAGSESDTCEVTVLPEPEVDVVSVNIFNQSGFTAILYVGDTLSLSAQVSPTDATYSSVTWSSTDSSIASVTSSGKVTAKGAGSATITATAQDATATYSITVKAREEPGVSPTENPDAGSTATPAPADAPTPVIETVTEIVTETVVREVVIKVDTTQLPEGTKYIKLPSGEIIELTGEETMSITVPEDSLNGDGTIEIVALSDEQVPLGSVEAEAVCAEAVNTPSDTPLWKMLVILLGGLAVGAAGALFAVRFVITKKRG